MSRKDIIDNIRDTLKGIQKGTAITLADGTSYVYKTTFALVSTKLKLFTEIGENYPAIFINAGDSNEEATKKRYYKSEMEFVLTMYYKQNDDIEDDLSDLFDDVTKAMMQDISRGGYATQTVLERSLSDSVSFTACGILELFYKVTYFYQC